MLEERAGECYELSGSKEVVRLTDGRGRNCSSTDTSDPISCKLWSKSSAHTWGPQSANASRLSPCAGGALSIWRAVMKPLRAPRLGIGSGVHSSPDEPPSSVTAKASSMENSEARGADWCARVYVGFWQKQQQHHPIRDRARDSSAGNPVDRSVAASTPRGSTVFRASRSCQALDLGSLLDLEV